MSRQWRSWLSWLWFPINCVQGLFTALWTALWISVALGLSFLTGRRAIGLWLAKWVWAPGLLRGAGARLEVSGLESIDCGRPYLLVANHQSWIDIPALFRASPRPLHFVGKEELARVPFLGAFMRAMGMVFVERSGGKRAARSLSQIRELLDSGAWVVSFPEGTRSRDGRLGAFRAGTFAPAIESGVAVLPVALEGPGKILPPGGFRVRPGKLHVCFGAPLPTADLRSSDRARLAQEAETAVRDLLARLRDGASSGA
jgi:1-acyl-sn-glycerol-3-phosphate acyltransferase